MFPLAHNLMAQRFWDNPKGKLAFDGYSLQYQLLMAGSIMPDLVSAMGMDRNYGHLMGQEIYNYAKQNQPEALGFALGIWLHGADPCGFDYYADEHWQGDKGWCFQKAGPYVDRVTKACNLPREWGLWKAHNFVEMAMELECTAQYPQLASALLATMADEAVQKAAAKLLVDFGGADGSKVSSIMAKVGEIFDLSQVSPEGLAAKYVIQLQARHGIIGANPKAMADIIISMRAEYNQEFKGWLDIVEALMTNSLKKAGANI